MTGTSGSGGDFRPERQFPSPKSDRVLVQLTEVVSFPSYFEECVEWLGWAMMTWSWVGLGFLLFTCANLVPRGRVNHKWYLDKFGED
ncbi:3-oxo-5-alpha-steroid 4-dehydrogenase, C-terminal [Parasponia andersonii]|uniref:3-oxo-5-alpha-steroid 4-dehydrogenase, C-terminal n=1 Tax=Parasponia andersonii TaxID=3476 RepID=A0A2P5AKL5_PARAD|nr:3-oxo-5-alpha-steroid 4-dehydrogenase, C-terminal [Parasponia andersonii]